MNDLVRTHSHDKFPEDSHLSLIDENLPLSLAVIRVLELGTEKSRETLESIGNAVNKGTLLISRCSFVPMFGGTEEKPEPEKVITIFFNKDFTPMFEKIENWIERRKRFRQNTA